jgi:hypothetical protein
MLSQISQPADREWRSANVSNEWNSTKRARQSMREEQDRNVYWYRYGSTGFSSIIGENPECILAKVKLTFANTSDRRLEQSLYYRKALNHSTMDQKLQCVRQSGKSPYHISIFPVLIIKNAVEFRQYWEKSTWLSQLVKVILANFRLLKLWMPEDDGWEVNSNGE